MMLFVCLIFEVTPFGNGTFLTGDLNGQYINYFAQIRNAFLEGNGMFYSLYKGLGGGMLGIISYYASSPFVLLYVLCNPVNYDILTTLVVCLKVIFISTSMAFFLHKKFKAGGYKIIIPSLAFGFCGYVFIYMQNFMWHDVLILLPLLLYGVDVLIEKKKPFIYAIVLFVMVFANFYIAYMACIFTVLYFLYSLALLPNINKKDAMAHMVRFGAASLLGGLLSAFLFIPALADITANKGVGEGFSLQFTAQFTLFEFLAQLFPFSFNWNFLEYGLPNVSSGIAIIIFALAFFFAKGISKKQKILSFAVLFILFLSMFSTDLMLVFHGLTAPVWFSHRHAFLFVFWLCFLAANALINGKFERKSIIAVCACTIALLVIRYITPQIIFVFTRFLICAIISVLTLLLFALHKKIKRFWVFGITALLIGELLLSVYYTNFQFEKYPADAYNNFVNDGTYLVEQIEKREGTDDLRIEKNYFRSLNDSFLLNYHGVIHFGSTQDGNATEYIRHLNVYNTFTAQADEKNGANIFALSLLGIKYMLINEENYMPEGLEKTDIEKGGISVWENPYAFELAFMLPQSESGYTVPYKYNKQYLNDVFTLLKHGAFEGELYEENGDINLQSLETLTAQLLEQSAQVNFTRGEVHAHINAQNDGVLFVSIPYSENLSITVNGENVSGTEVFTTQLGVPVLKGENEIIITYKPPLLYEGLIVSIISALLLGLWWLFDKKEKHKSVNI